MYGMTSPASSLGASGKDPAIAKPEDSAQAGWVGMATVGKYKLSMMLLGQESSASLSFHAPITSPWGAVVPGLQVDMASTTALLTESLKNTVGPS